VQRREERNNITENEHEKIKIVKRRNLKNPKLKRFVCLWLKNYDFHERKTFNVKGSNNPTYQEENVMRKMSFYGLAVVLTALACCGSAYGAVSFIVPGFGGYDIMPGHEITITLYSTLTNVFGMQFDVLTTFGGTASNPHLAAGWNAGYEGLPVNDGNTLIRYVQTTQTGVPPTKLGGDLFHFTYRIPAIPLSSLLIISAGPYGGTDAPYVATLDGTTRVDVIPASLVLHMIPEPASLALLAFGSFAALRRWRA
jgi:hypothetical protein